MEYILTLVRYDHTREDKVVYHVGSVEEADDRVAADFSELYQIGVPILKDKNETVAKVYPVTFKDREGFIYKDVLPSSYSLSLFPEREVITPCIPFTTEEIQKEEFSQLVYSMYSTMYANRGIGLAANQIGLNRQLFVMDVNLHERGTASPEAFINPTVIDFEGKQTGEEGCLSVPGFRQKMVRPEEITIEALGMNGETKTIVATGLEAACISHEINHLFGRTIIHEASNYKRGNYLKQYKEAKRTLKKRVRLLGV